MRKEIVLPTGVVLAGVAGFFLRRWELASAFEPGTGLPIWGQPATWCLMGLSAAVVLVALLCSLGTNREYPGGYDQAFAAHYPLYLLGMAAAALALMGAAAIGVYEYATKVEPTALRLALALLCAFGGVSLVVVAQNCYGGKRQGKNSLYLLAPAYACCLWLFVAYLDRAGDPVVLDYVYGLLAIVSAVLSCYFMAGFSYQKGRSVQTIFFSLSGVYFGLVALANGGDRFFGLLHGGLVLYQLVSAAVLLYRTAHPAVFELEVATDES